MTPRNAAFLALVGTLLVTVVEAFRLVMNVVNVARGLTPMVSLFSSLIFTFAWLTLVVFFAVFRSRG